MNAPYPDEWDDPQPGESYDEVSERERAAGCSVSNELRELEKVQS